MFLYFCVASIGLMYQLLLFYHSVVRWFVLAGLLTVIYRAWLGYSKKKSFSAIDNAVRHWTATIAHIQLLIGIGLYTQSPLIKYFWKHKREALLNSDALFFSLIHILLMLSAIVIITIGAAIAKRKTADIEKHRTLLHWFSLALLIIIIAIPWPFSPWVHRPYLR